MSGRLREDSKKYRKAAVRINWELLLKQVMSSWPVGSGPIVADCLIVRSFRSYGPHGCIFPLVALFLS